MQPEIRIADIPLHATAPEMPQLLAAWEARSGAPGGVPLEDLLAGVEDLRADMQILEERGGRWRVRTPCAAADVARGRPAGDGSALPGSGVVLGRAMAEGRPVLEVGAASPADGVEGWERLVLPCRTKEGIPTVVALTRPRLSREDLLGAVLDATCDGMMSVRALRDGRGRLTDAVILTANRQAADYCGHPVSRLVGGRLKDLFPGLRSRAFWSRCLRVITERTTERFELNLSHRQLDTWLRITAVPLDDGFVLSFHDITDLKYALFEAECSREELAAEVAQRKALESELRRLSLTDDLTGVLNRRGFSGSVRTQTAAARRYGQALALVAIDIDHFKRINDRHGHAAGDTVLMAVAAFFADTIRRDLDLLGRVGGEEFMILLPQTELPGALILAERIRSGLADLPVETEGGTLRITASFGVRTYDPTLDADTFLNDADKALYAAKAAGRNRVVAWAEEMAGAEREMEGVG